jgi:hypothetical protein
MGSIPGNIPLQTEIDVCNQANYRYFHEWQDLATEQKALLTAQYYNRNLIESHKQDQQAQEMKKNQRSKGAKGTKRR